MNNLNIYNIIFGFLKSQSNILNYVCLQAKYYIYINRLKENKPHLSRFKDILNRNLSIEKLICIKQHKLHDWNKFKQLHYLCD